MSEIDIPVRNDGHEEHEDLDNPLRAIVVVNTPDVPEGEMEERMLDNIQTFDEVEKFFDTFDEKVAYPNEGHLKYEVGSDGLVIFVVDSTKLKDEVLSFLDKFVTEFENTIEDDVVEEGSRKKKRS